MWILYRPNNPKIKNDNDYLTQTLKDCYKENLSEEPTKIIPTNVLWMLEKVLKKPFGLLPILNLAIILEILIQFVLKNLLWMGSDHFSGQSTPMLHCFQPFQLFFHVQSKYLLLLKSQVSVIRTENKGANEIKKLYKFIPKNFINTW